MLDSELLCLYLRLKQIEKTFYTYILVLPVAVWKLWESEFLLRIGTFNTIYNQGRIGWFQSVNLLVSKI